jgi:hypothetical protein
MYPERHYLTRSILARELSELPENIGRKKAYLALSTNWKRLADMVAKSAIPPKSLARLAQSRQPSF